MKKETRGMRWTGFSGKIRSTNVIVVDNRRSLSIGERGGIWFDENSFSLSFISSGGCSGVLLSLFSSARSKFGGGGTVIAVSAWSMLSALMAEDEDGDSLGEEGSESFPGAISFSFCLRILYRRSWKILQSYQWHC